MYRTTRRLLVSLALPAVVSCGKGGGGSFDSSHDPIGASSSGLPAQRLLLELDAAASRQLCQWGAGAVDPGLGRLCTYLAVPFATDQYDCDSARSECLQEGYIAPDCRQAKQDVPADCRATVGHYERCMSAIGRDFAAALAELTCEDYGDRELAAQIETAELPGACRDVEETCPGLLGPGLHQVVGR